MPINTPDDVATVQFLQLHNQFLRKEFEAITTPYEADCVVLNVSHNFLEVALMYD